MSCVDSFTSARQCGFSYDAKHHFVNLDVVVVCDFCGQDRNTLPWLIED